VSALKMISPLLARAGRGEGDRGAAKRRPAGEKPRTATRRAELWKDPVPLLEDREGRLHLLL
jgi:hypothetical protein